MLYRNKKTHNYGKRKKLLAGMIFVLLIMMFSGNVLAVDSTYTIDENTLQEIRDACNDTIQSDPLIYQYWEEYTRELRDPDPQDYLFHGFRDYPNLFFLETNAIKAYKGIINDNDNGNIDEVISFLLNEFDWEDYKIRLYDSPFTDPEQYETPNGDEVFGTYNRGLTMAYGLNFIAFMADMTYYYMDSNEQSAIVDSLNDLIDWAIDDIYGNDGWVWETGWCHDNWNNYLLPKIESDSFRLINISGVGYCCLVAGDELVTGDRLQDFVMEQFW